jgi:hypothetical protein
MGRKTEEEKKIVAERKRYITKTAEFELNPSHLVCPLLVHCGKNKHIIVQVHEKSME